MTRLHPQTNQLQFVAIERDDLPDTWALPGGFMSGTEKVSETVRREFLEEAVASYSRTLEGEGGADASDRYDDDAPQRLRDRLDQLFGEGGREVYRGYVDDPRTTDDAWIETVVFHFHCPPEIGDKLSLSAGEEVKRAVWLDVNPASESRYRNLYASHREWVDRIAETFAPHEKARSQELHSLKDKDNSYPLRWRVDDEYVDWDTACPDYNPPDFTAREVRQVGIVFFQHGARIRQLSQNRAISLACLDDGPEPA